MSKWLAFASLVVISVALVVGVADSRRDDLSFNSMVPGTHCLTDTRNELAAQAVPGATLVPCLSDLGGRWSVVDETIQSGSAHVEVTTTEADDASWAIDFAATCDVDPSAAPASLPDDVAQDGVEVRQHDDDTGSRFVRTQYRVFAGGCVVSRLSLPQRFDRDVVLTEVDRTLLLIPRETLNLQVQQQTDGELQLDP